MATTLGALQVDLRANTAQFVKGMQTARSKVGNLSKEVGASVKKLANFKTALLAAAGIGGMGALIGQSFKAIDALAKTSDKLGIATEKLAGLQFAAQKAGISSQTMGLALQRSTRRISEAAQGAGEAKDAIKELGLNAQQLAALSPDQQFRAIAVAMQDVATQGDKVRLAMKLFDSEGVSVINTFSRGVEQLDEATAAAERFGLSINRVDAAKIEMANDALTDLRASFTGTANVIAVELAPLITAISGKVVESRGDIAGFRNFVIDSMESMATGVAIFADSWDFIKRAVQGIRAVFWGFVSGTLKGLEHLNEGLRAFINLIPGVDIGPIESLANSIDFANGQLNDAVANVMTLANGPSNYEGVKQFFADLKAEANAAAKEIAAASPTGGGGNGDLPQHEIDTSVNRVLLLQDEIAQKQDILGAFGKWKIENDKALDQAEADMQAKRISVAKGALGNLSQLMSSESKKQFKIGKQAAIAQTIIATIESAQQAYKALAGIPIVGPALGIAAAGAAILAGNARVNAIRSTSFGGGGSAGSGGGGGGGGVGGGATQTTQTPIGAVPPNLDVDQAAGGGGTIKIVNVAEDSVLTGRQLVEIINEATGDNVVLQPA